MIRTKLRIIGRIKRKTKAKKYSLFLAVAAFFCFLFPYVSKAENLKIGFVTDWEYGSEKKYTHKYPRKAEKYLERAVNFYNSDFDPDLVVGGGDYVVSSSRNKKKVRRQLQKINKIFQSLDAPRLYCIGNHDVRTISSEAEVGRILGIDYTHSVTDIGGVRIITLDTNHRDSSKGKYKTTGRVSDEELDWLEDQLETELPVIVFSHHSPIQTPEGKKWRTNIISAFQVRNVLEKYGNVVAVFSGHHAINYSEEVNGITYFIINNLTDIKALGSYAAINVTVSGGKQVNIEVQQYGKKPATYSIEKRIL